MATLPRFTPPIYTISQLHAFFTRISLPRSIISGIIDVTTNPPILHSTFTPTLAALTALQTHALATIPFESLSLHYSSHHSINLDPEFLFQKIVGDGRGRGGYCMEKSTLFCTVLRSLGYEVYSTGARVNEASTGRASEEGWEGPKYMGWNHMVNLVTISGITYAVDIGFGSSGPHHPMPLIPAGGYQGQNVGSQEVLLSHEPIPDGSTRQKWWVYKYRHNATADWVPAYCFSQLEFLAEDFKVLNLGTSSGKGLFTENVLCVKMIMESGSGSRSSSEDGEGDEALRLIGDVTLFASSVKRRINGQSEILCECKTEKERVEALQRWLGVQLMAEEREGILGMQSQLSPL